MKIQINLNGEILNAILIDGPNKYGMCRVSVDGLEISILEKRILKN